MWGLKNAEGYGNLKESKLCLLRKGLLHGLAEHVVCSFFSAFWGQKFCGKRKKRLTPDGSDDIILYYEDGVKGGERMSGDKREDKDSFWDISKLVPRTEVRVPR